MSGELVSKSNNDIPTHIDTPHFYFVKDAFKVCVSSELGQYVSLDGGTAPFKSGHANLSREADVSLNH